jgi:DNA-binding transcriptional regulator YdaS (Cro superfamily)
MDLKTYIKDPQRRADLAALVNSSGDYLYQIATNRRKASSKLAQEIDAATERLGPERVTKESLRPDIWSEPEKARAA